MWASSLILRAIFYLAIALSAIAAGPVLSSSKNGEKADEVSYRLPNNTRPVIYDIHLTTNVDKGEFNFTGKVIITLEVFEKSSDIVLHMRQLKIGDISLVSARDATETYNVNYTYDEATEFLKITSRDVQIETGMKRLEIDYTGELRKDNAGFYLSTYTRSDGSIVNLATTQFESTDARHAFPCYDEPAKKAVFNIKLTHGKDYTALSNMPVFGNIVNNTDGTVTTTFEPTRLMSSYLVAFIVSDFVETEVIDRIPHRIYSRPGTINDQSFALQTSGDTLNAIEDYLGVKYSLPKMDNVAVPDFAAGAMENWGLVTYREEYLLYDEKKSTSGTKLNIATIEAHEFGHQWFGDLVSPFWWTFLWLNEGFASMFAYISTDTIFPEWDVWQDFIVSDLQRALLADGRVSPRPMTHYVESPTAISGIFDAVSYSKSASVLIMFRHALTDATFKKALNDYLKKMQYTSAVEDDLFESFKKAAEEDKIFGTTSIDYMKIFKSWTNQGGYPLITVERNYAAGTFTIRQEPFDGSEKTPVTDKRSWWVPYTFATANNSHFKVTTMDGYLNIGESSKTISQGNQIWSDKDWIILNKRATNYYRVNYDEQNWKLLAQALRDEPLNFHVHNRAQLLDDAFRLGMAKRLPFSTILDLSSYLSKETDYAPWLTANAFLTTLNNYLSADKEYDVFQFYVGTIVGDFYKTVGATENSGDPHLRKMIRSVAVNWACRANFGDCIEVTNSRLSEFITSNKEIEPNMRNSIFCNGLTKANENDFNFVLNFLMESTDQAVRRQLMSSAMGCTQNVDLLKKYLKTSIDHTAAVNYREQERLNVVNGVVDKGAVQLETVINFLKENHLEYAKLATDFNQNSPVLLAIRSIANRVVTKEQEVQFESLLTLLKNIEGIKDTDYTAVRSTVKTNLDWITENRSKLTDWLRTYKRNKTGGAATIIVSTSSILAVVFVTLRSVF